MFTIESHVAMNGRWTSIIFFAKTPIYKSKGNLTRDQAEANAWYGFGHHLRRLIAMSEEEVAAEMEAEGA